MCIAAVAWRAHPHWRFVAIANRDEFHARPAAALAEWSDGSEVIAGRDLAGGGTWLGAARNGRFALLTNHRSPLPPDLGKASRGELVTDWLTSGRGPEEPQDYNGFNLLLADGEGMTFVSNRPNSVNRSLAPGVHGLSNGPLAPPWPKTKRLSAQLAGWLEADDAGFAPLFAALSATGPEAEAESESAPVFILDPTYGTRCSTVFAMDRDGAVHFEERSFDMHGEPTGTVRMAWQSEAAL